MSFRRLYDCESIVCRISTRLICFRNGVSSIEKDSDTHRMFTTSKSHKKMVGAFLTRIDDTMIFTEKDATDTLQDLYDRRVAIFEIEFANESSLLTNAAPRRSTSENREFQFYA